MLEHEHTHPRAYTPHAQYIKHRRIIVEWMFETGEEFKLNTFVTHSAVRYLDRLLSEWDVDKDKWQLIAIGCLLVAAKYEEEDERIPSINDLNECSNNIYTIEMVRDVELSILQRMEWKLGGFTTLHFICHFTSRGCISINDRVDGPTSSPMLVGLYLNK
jgi:hypothetical protein